MAFKRSSVRFRLAPPPNFFRGLENLGRPNFSWECLGTAQALGLDYLEFCTQIYTLGGAQRCGDDAVARLWGSPPPGDSFWKMVDKKGFKTSV